MNAIKVASTVGMTREEWLLTRRQGIGGSDIAAIAGLNKYKSPMGVYLDKVGETPIEDTAGEAAYWGNVLEEVVAKEFQERTGEKVRRDNRMLAHPEHPYLMANLDRVVVGKKEILECKTSSAYRLKEWESDEVPMEYLLQIMHYLAVTGYERAHIAVLVGGQKFIHKTIERDEELIQQIIDMASDFWNNHVMTKTPPPYDGSSATSNFLSAMFPQADQETETVLDDEADALITQYQEAKEREEAAKKDKTEAENKLKGMVGLAELGLAGNYVVEWKNVKGRETLDTKAFKAENAELYEKYKKEGKPTRRFAIKEAK